MPLENVMWHHFGWSTPCIARMGIYDIQGPGTIEPSTHQTLVLGKSI